MEDGIAKTAMDGFKNFLMHAFGQKSGPEEGISDDIGDFVHKHKGIVAGILGFFFSKMFASGMTGTGLKIGSLALALVSAYNDFIPEEKPGMDLS